MCSSGILLYFLKTDIVNYLPHISLCPFHAITGFPCPGCGMTRSLLFIGQLRLEEALYLNPFSIPLFIVMLFYLCTRRIPVWFKNNVFICTATAIVLTLWILRLINI